MATELGAVIEQTIRQELQPAILESLPMEDPIWTEILRESVGVARDARIGRDFLVQKVYRTGVGGAGHWGQLAGGDLLDTEAGTATGARILDAPRTYPAHNEGTSSEFLTVQISLIKYRGNIHLDESVLLAAELDASIGNVVAMKIKDAARKFASSLTTSFYALATQGSGSDIDNTLGVIGSTHTDPDDSGNAAVVGDSAVTVNLSAGQLANFYPGQMLEAFDTVGTARRHSSAATLRTSGDSFLVVDVVDRVGGTMILRLHGGGTFDTEFVTGDLLIPQRDATATFNDIRNTASGEAKARAPYGLNDWLKGSGTLFNEQGETGISLTNYPQFKSVTSALTGVLDEADLNKFLGRFWQHYGGHVDLDTIITTMGVINGFTTAQDGAFKWERNDKALASKVGWTTFDYTLNGRNFRVLLSRGLETGACVALSLRDNVKMYVPPSQSQFQTDSRFSPLIEFVGGANGSIFKPYHHNSLTSEYQEAPFRAFLNIVPDDPQGVKLTGLTEDI